MNADVQKSNRKAELLANTVEHVAIDQYDARPVIDAMRKMSFTS
ncbi:MAG: deoxyhypusine synthase, partial [Phenylobacterium sp.]|nr:deoxyhypusine synthase [Phenylobacterium sp.]